MTTTDRRAAAAAAHYDTADASDEIAAAELTPGDPAATSALAGYSVRLPVDVLASVRTLAKDRGISTGAWLREAIETAVAARTTDPETVPAAALLALIEDYRPGGRQSNQRKRAAGE